ncbi:MAG: transposase [Muribaculaceae bacterium]|nr:transposase [Muribaculaceae bacterium]
MSTVKSLYHIVINTKHRQMTIPEENKRRLYLYIYGLIQNQKCTLIRMNGIPNHIHLLIDLSVEISLKSATRCLPVQN